MNEYETRYVENLLDEVLGETTPPELSQQILRRRDALPNHTVPDSGILAGNGTAKKACARHSLWRERLPAWVAAASIFVGVALMIFGEHRPMDVPQPSTSSETPGEEDGATNNTAHGPASVIFDAHGDAELRALPSSTRALRAFGVTDAGIGTLKRFSNLRYLEVRRSDDVGDEGVAVICRLAMLEELHLVITSELRGESWRALSNLRNVRSLGLYSIWLPDEATSVIASLPSLRELDLSGCMNLTDEGFARLGALAKLESLRLDFCFRITDEGLGAIGRLAELHELDLDNCWRITDEGLKQIGRLQKLESLTLRLCERITDAGLAHVVGLSKLQKLNLQDCSEVTEGGVRMVKDALPRCSVLTGSR